MAKHILNYKIVKIGPHCVYFFQEEGGGGGTEMRKEDGEKKWKSESFDKIKIVWALKFKKEGDHVEGEGARPPAPPP